MIADFLNWCTHLARHRVPLFWHFHEVHHSQRSLNMLTESREHFTEAMIASTVVFVPVVLLGASFKVIAGTVTFTVFYNYFQHSNIRTNLGPLRHVLVTPQSHRVHHSLPPRAPRHELRGHLQRVGPDLPHRGPRVDGNEVPAHGNRQRALPHRGERPLPGPRGDLRPADSVPVPGVERTLTTVRPPAEAPAPRRAATRRQELMAGRVRPRGVATGRSGVTPAPPG